jgi:hypothetical protein
LLSWPHGDVVYKWYEAQVRLQLLAGRQSFWGASAANVCNLCLASMSRADLNLEDPRVLDIFSDALHITIYEFIQKVRPRDFACLVETRDMGSDNLDFSFVQVLEGIVSLIWNHQHQT